MHTITNKASKFVRTKSKTVDNNCGITYQDK